MYQSFDLDKLRQNNPNAAARRPFEHQLDAFEKLAKLFTFTNNEHKAGILVLPTGAGKTFTSVNWICRNVLSKKIKVLWLAHTGHLLEQAYDTFRNDLLSIPQRHSLNMRLVSSDPLHSNASQIDPSDDVLIITTQTAISNTETATLDEQGKPRKTAFEKFLEHSRQTGLFVVLDEAHHAPAYGCRNLLIGGSRFADGIRQKVPNSHFLGLTATPTYSDTRRLGWLWEIFKDGIIDNADKAALIRQGILAVPHYIQRNTGKEYPVDDSLYERLVRQHKDLPEDLIERLAKDSGRNDYIVNDYLDNYQTYGKTLIFADRWTQCVYIKNKLMQRAGERGINLRVDAVYSHVDARGATVEERNQRNAAENNRILQAFRDNELDVLLNVRMLSEGTDVPNVKTVFITRQTTSGILLTQMVGRALRGRAANGEKDSANIVFFVDSWQKLINFATPETGDLAESEPLVRGAYPLEFISIELVENLSRQIDSGLEFSERTYLHGLPVGWYETAVTVSVGSGTDTFHEFVVVFELSRSRFAAFVQHLQQAGVLTSEWEKEDLDEAFAQQQAEQWATEFFAPSDNANGLLVTDLIKLARHIGQSRTKEAPPFQAFAERDKHDLGRIADELAEFNVSEIFDQLQTMYHSSDYLWAKLYHSFQRFKTAFNTEQDRLQYRRKFGNGLTLEIATPVQRPVAQRELNEDDKEKVFRRDNHTCLCCGKQKGRGIRLEVDHINPYKFSADTSLSNSQTLCSTCNRDKATHAINFLLLKTPLSAPKALLPLKKGSEEIEVILTRAINFFYHCRALDTVHYHSRSTGKHHRVWEIILFEGNNPAWLETHKNQLIQFIRRETKYTSLEDIVVR